MPSRVHGVPRILRGGGGEKVLLRQGLRLRSGARETDGGGRRNRALHGGRRVGGGGSRGGLEELIRN